MMAMGMNATWHIGQSDEPWRARFRANRRWLDHHHRELPATFGGAGQHHEGRLLTLTERLHEVFEASREMVRPTIYGQAIIFLVFAPLLTFTGVEGKCSDQWRSP